MSKKELPINGIIGQIAREGDNKIIIAAIKQNILSLVALILFIKAMKQEIMSKEEIKELINKILDIWS